MTKVDATLQFLARVAQDAGAAEHTYVVGGAVRNTLMGLAPKDLDLVVDSVALGRDSQWFADQLMEAVPADTKLVTNQYGVALVTVVGTWKLNGHEMRGEVFEIANARSESYDKTGAGKGYKPTSVMAATIHADLARRDFTINTLLWRLDSCLGGLGTAQVLDLTGLGLADLEARVLRTPCDPDVTFTDDPTRMLRSVRFVAKYGFSLHSDTEESIRRNAMALLQMPWDAVRKILVEDILLGSNPRESVGQMVRLGLNAPLVKLLQEESGFNVGVSRGLAGVDPLLLLDLWDLGWRLRGTVASMVTAEELPRLRENLTRDPSFLQSFLKPPLNQEAVFSELQIPAKERGKVSQTARRLLLERPELAQGGLEEAVKEVLRGYSSSGSSSTT